MYTENIQSPSIHSSFKLNGIKLRQKYLEYFVDQTVFLKLLPKSNVSICDRVITIYMVLINQLNQMYEIARVSSNVCYSNSNVMNTTVHRRKEKVKYNNIAYTAKHIETCDVKNY